jgi:hypothetical protein
LDISYYIAFQNCSLCLPSKLIPNQLNIISYAHRKVFSFFPNTNSFGLFLISSIFGGSLFLHIPIPDLNLLCSCFLVESFLLQSLLLIHLVLPYHNLFLLLQFLPILHGFLFLIVETAICWIV